MAMLHNAQPWDETPESFEDSCPDDEYAADIAALTAGVELPEDFFLEEQFEDLTSGTMFNELDD